MAVMGITRPCDAGYSRPFPLSRCFSEREVQDAKGRARPLTGSEI